MDEINSSESCELGRKEYWENFYSKELENFSEYGDEGDVWFGKANVQRITKWLQNHSIDKTASILDIGCGNAYSLVCLGKAGYSDLTGIDYAKEAIQLAENVAKNNDIPVKLEVADILRNDPPSILNNKFHVIIDKGTYDAICLDQTRAKEKRSQYVRQIHQILSADGYFILLSCNWTKEELLNQFTGFTLYDEIETPKLSFGGKTGQTVAAIVLRNSV